MGDGMGAFGKFRGLGKTQAVCGATECHINDSSRSPRRKIKRQLHGRMPPTHSTTQPLHHPITQPPNWQGKPTHSPTCPTHLRILTGLNFSVFRRLLQQRQPLPFSFSRAIEVQNAFGNRIAS